MPASASGDRKEFIRLLPLAAPGPWKGVLLPVSSFPTPEAELAPVRMFLQKLVRSIGTRAAVVETFIQLAGLHLADGAAHLTAHGQKWRPQMGLGVWPDREPPTGWTLEELQELVPGEKPRPLMNIALRLTGLPEARHQARDVLVGRGTIVQFLANLEGEKLLTRARDVLFPPIKDPSFTSFSFYIPLLETKSLAKATADQLDAWCCGAHAYIRESPEDAGILILSKSLDETLHRIGGSLSSTEPREWQVPREPHAAS